MEELAKKITKILNSSEYDYDEPITTDDILGWMKDIDEDDLISQSPETLADWFYNSY